MNIKTEKVLKKLENVENNTISMMFYDKQLLDLVSKISLQCSLYNVSLCVDKSSRVITVLLLLIFLGVN